MKRIVATLKALYRKSDRFFHLLVGMPSYDKLCRVYAAKPPR